MLSAQLVTLVLALVIDRLIGDPPRLWRRVPHPVVLMGRGIAALDAGWNDPALPSRARRGRGVAATVLLISVVALAGAALQTSLPPSPPALVVEALIASVLLAHKSLVQHVAAVADGLDAAGPPGGRAEVAQIVGRDVSLLDEAGVARAAIESAAENFSDGVVAPAFWYALLGLPGLIAFKLVSTADSMIGNRSPRHADFGWAAARLDDALNLIPARLTAALIALAAAIIGGNARVALRTALREARLHKSPNAGWPEAALAGALGIALGGPRRYGDAFVDGAWFHGGGRMDVGAGDIRDAIRLIDVTWALLVALIAGAAFTVLWIAR